MDHHCWRIQLFGITALDWRCTDFIKLKCSPPNRRVRRRLHWLVSLCLPGEWFSSKFHCWNNRDCKIRGVRLADHYRLVVSKADAIWMRHAATIQSICGCYGQNRTQLLVILVVVTAVIPNQPCVVACVVANQATTIAGAAVGTWICCFRLPFSELELQLLGGGARGIPYTLQCLNEQLISLQRKDSRWYVDMSTVGLALFHPPVLKGTTSCNRWTSSWLTSASPTQFPTTQSNGPTLRHAPS